MGGRALLSEAWRGPEGANWRPPGQRRVFDLGDIAISNAPSLDAGRGIDNPGDGRQYDADAS